MSEATGSVRVELIGTLNDLARSLRAEDGFGCTAHMQVSLSPGAGSYSELADACDTIAKDIQEASVKPDG